MQIGKLTDISNCAQYIAFVRYNTTNYMYHRRYFILYPIRDQYHREKLILLCKIVINAILTGYRSDLIVRFQMIHDCTARGEILSTKFLPFETDYYEKCH